MATCSASLKPPLIPWPFHNSPYCFACTLCSSRPLDLRWGKRNGKGTVIADLGSKANKEEREMLEEVGNRLGTSRSRRA